MIFTSNLKQLELLSNHPYMYILSVVTADQNLFSVLIFDWVIPVYTGFPCVCLYLLQQTLDVRAEVRLVSTFFETISVS